mgnify:CR=1 FL=1
MNIEYPSQHNTYGVILAGGNSVRMGRHHKGLMMLDNTTLLEKIIHRLQPQVAQIILNINTNPELYRHYTELYALTQVADDTTSAQGSLGPLAGICTAMSAVKTTNHNAKWLLTVPCDSPRLPEDLLIQLSSVVKNKPMQVVNPISNGKKHHVIGVWSLDLEEPLRKFLYSGQRAVGKFLQSVNNTSLPFSTDDYDPFFNVNTPDDYAALTGIK